MSKPITPDEIGLYAQKTFPGFVFEGVNRLLARGNTTLRQDEVIESIIDAAYESGTAITKAEIYNKHYLDFEEAYRAAGWSVYYDKPGYNESYEANFVFKRKK